MQTNLENIIDSNYSILLDNILSYFGSVNGTTYTKSLIDKALVLLSKFPLTESTAFFKMDTDSFEFSLHSYYPDSTFDFFNEVLASITTNGAIGISIQTNRFYQSLDESNNKTYLILPIFSSNSVIGVFVITSIINFSEIGINYSNLMMLFARSFGNLIENKELNIKHKQNADLIDQLVASRTIELVENNQALGNKIESLKTNLSMSIPHEVRTPINEILGMTNYLDSIISQYAKIPQNDKDEVIEIVGDIKSSANRLKNLFENFIYHTRLSIISTSLREIEQIQSKVSPYCDSIIFEQAHLKAQTHNREDDLILNQIGRAHV